MSLDEHLKYNKKTEFVNPGTAGTEETKETDDMIVLPGLSGN